MWNKVFEFCCINIIYLLVYAIRLYQRIRYFQPQTLDWHERHELNIELCFRTYAILDSSVLSRLETYTSGLTLHHIRPEISSHTHSRHWIVFPGYNQHSFLQYRELIQMASKDHLWIVEYPGSNGEFHSNPQDLHLWLGIFARSPESTAGHESRASHYSFL